MTNRDKAKALIMRFHEEGLTEVEAAEIFVQAIELIVGKKKKSAPTDSPAAWDAYSEAFKKSHGVAAHRDRQVNAMIRNVIDRAGADVAPLLLRFYCEQTDAIYMKNHHPLTLLLRDFTGIKARFDGAKVYSDKGSRDREILESNLRRGREFTRGK